MLSVQRGRCVPVPARNLRSVKAGVTMVVAAAAVFAARESVGCQFASSLTAHNAPITFPSSRFGIATDHRGLRSC